MALGGSDRLGFRGAIASIAPPGFAPVLTPLRTPMALTYHEFKAVCLSSVRKHTHSHNSHSFRIYMFSNNVDLKTNNRSYRQPS